MSNIKPFAAEGISDLTIDEKLRILCAVNPINEIIQIANCEKVSGFNVILKNPDDPQMTVITGTENNLRTGKVDTDIGLTLLIESKIVDLSLLLYSMMYFLDKTFIYDFVGYLAGGCNIEPDFRKEACSPSDILRENVTVELVKAYEKKLEQLNK